MIVRMLMIPSKYAVIARVADDSLLQPIEGLLTFAVQQRHVDIENTKQRVGHVLNSSRASPSGPTMIVPSAISVMLVSHDHLRHSPGDTNVMNCASPTEDICINTSDL